MNWFPDKETRGSWYSLLSTNQNLGGTVAPKLLPPLMARFGWATALWGPAVFTLGYGGLQSCFLKPGPYDAQRAVAASSGRALDTTSTIPDSPPISPALQPSTRPVVAQSPGDGNAIPGLVETFTCLLKMRSFICLCLGYIPVMMLRTSLTNWTPVMFASNGLSLAMAASCMSILELGSFVGGLCGGWITDKIGGRRGPVMCCFSLLTVPISIGAAAAIKTPRLLPVTYFLHGFFSFSPHSLVGLMAREVSPPLMRCAPPRTQSLGHSRMRPQNVLMPELVPFFVGQLQAAWRRPWGRRVRWQLGIHCSYLPREVVAGGWSGQSTQSVGSLRP